MENVLVVNPNKISNALLDSLYNLVVPKKHEVSKVIGSASNQFLKRKNMNEEAKCSMQWFSPCLKDPTSKIWHGNFLNEAYGW